MFRPPEDKSSCSVSSRLTTAWRLNPCPVRVMIVGRMVTFFVDQMVLGKGRWGGLFVCDERLGTTSVRRNSNTITFCIEEITKKNWVLAGHDESNRESGFNFLFFFFVFAPSQGHYFLLGCSAHDCAEGSERAENVQKRRNLKI